MLRFFSSDRVRLERWLFNPNHIMLFGKEV